MTREEAKGNLIHAIRWNDMPKKEALDIAIKALEQKPCENAISRQAVLDLVVANHTELNGVNVVMYSPLCKDIKQLPPVTSQPKIGKWIKQVLSVKPFGEDTVLCDQCAFMTDKDSQYNYCPNCRAKMQEVEE